jgi:hypothetical protein
LIEEAVFVEGVKRLLLEEAASDFLKEAVLFEGVKRLLLA